MKQWHIRFVSLIWIALVILVATTPALAHEAPEGAEWLMADWMLFAFLVFFGVALIIFLTAVKRGYLRNLEDAKYYILSIDEPDYYTPEWAKEDG